MRVFFSLFLLIAFVQHSWAQSGTEVYLLDLNYQDGSYSISNPQNISNNSGYDNQPSFSSDGTILYYTSNRNGETDLVAYDLISGKKTWLTTTIHRSEYSPTVTPDGNYISFISLTNDGVQEFRKMNLNSGEEELIEAESIIGYFVWIDSETYLCFVLATEESPSTLQIQNINTGEKRILGENPGRSFHKIPGSKSYSYILNDENVGKVFSYYPETESSDEIGRTIENSQDLAWTPYGHILMGNSSTLYAFLNNSWKPIADVREFELSEISRLAVSSDGNRIAIVVAE